MEFFLRRLKLTYVLEKSCPEAPSSEFKMVDDKSITEQVQEFQLIANKIAIAGIALDENFHVGAIVSKLTPSWKEYRSKLLHKKEDLTLEQLLQHLQIEQET
ncbi:hypothetical protein H5410_061361 [Solanum commersonii]|uniref:Uncharacterized protein n=1 Tax=Solanum commersonii TaxID=4109 RepID=A0A9J5W7I5_SOLCO|nr:hypothetical protein H5410_061361 [Solanum commersonii]